MSSWSHLLRVSALVGLGLMSLANAAQALVITKSFSAVANSGGGSGTITFDDGGGSTRLTLRINNTSPNLTSTGTQNSSIITGWGFDSTPDLPAIQSWTIVSGTGVNLTSYYSFSEDKGFGGAGGGGAVENLFKTKNGINGGIYNAAAPGNIANAFPDIAVVTINFCTPFSLAVIPTATLRMQRVGINGAGSLKILATSEQIQSADEPGAMALFGFGLFGLYMRRRLARHSAHLSARRAA